MAYPTTLYVTKKDESYFTITGAKLRSMVTIDAIFDGRTYRNDPVAIANMDAGFTQGSYTAPSSAPGTAVTTTGVYASSGSNLLAYIAESDLTTATAPFKLETKKSQFVWYDSPVLVRSVTTVSASTTVTIGATTGLIVGMGVSGTGIPTGSTIVSLDTATTFTISQPATASGTVNMTTEGNIVGDCWVDDYSHESGSIPAYLA